MKDFVISVSLKRNPPVLMEKVGHIYPMIDSKRKAICPISIWNLHLDLDQDIYMIYPFLSLYVSIVLDHFFSHECPSSVNNTQHAKTR